ncbi:MAG: AAA family ATPase [Deinococcota bacterium]
MLKRRELRVKTDQKIVPFQLGVIVESLQGIGMATDDAIRLARGAEKHFRAEGKTSVAVDLLTDWLEQTLAEDQPKALVTRFHKQTPPFIPLQVQHNHKQSAFSKRRLAESLEPLGLPFKQAYTLSRQVEQQLRSEGARVVGRRDLNLRIALSLETRYGRDMALKFEAQSPERLELYIDESRDLKLPYSRGVLARSLTTIGLAPEHAHYLAKRVETLLWRSGEDSIARNYLREVVAGLLAEEAGQDYAMRYRQMRHLRRPRLPLIVLIGGAPGVGKSRVASELSYRLGIPRIVSSDAIRQALRSLISKELSPTLHSSSYEAWHAELLPDEHHTARPKRKRVTRGFQHQLRQLSNPLTAIVQRNSDEATSLVLEGIHVVPGFLQLASLEDVLMVEVVLTIDDEATHRKHFEHRDIETGRKRSSQKYLEHFTEIRIIDEFICQQANNHGVPVIEASNIDKATQRVLELCLEVATPVDVDSQLEDQPDDAAQQQLEQHPHPQADPQTDSQLLEQLQARANVPHQVTQDISDKITQDVAPDVPHEATQNVLGNAPDAPPPAHLPEPNLAESNLAEPNLADDTPASDGLPARNIAVD